MFVLRNVWKREISNKTIWNLNNFLFSNFYEKFLIHLLLIFKALFQNICTQYKNTNESKNNIQILTTFICNDKRK